MRLCKDCGHASIDHVWDGITVRPARCRVEIDDETGMGMIVCGCLGWR